MITIVRKTGNAPIKHIASLTNPERPGNPKPAKKAKATIAVYIGICDARPPKPSISR